MIYLMQAVQIGKKDAKKIHVIQVAVERKLKNSNFRKDKSSNIDSFRKCFRKLEVLTSLF